MHFSFYYKPYFGLVVKKSCQISSFCRSRRADSKYIYFVGSHEVFFYYNYIIGGKNSKIVQIPRLSHTYISRLLDKKVEPKMHHRIKKVNWIQMIEYWQKICWKNPNLHDLHLHVVVLLNFCLLYKLCQKYKNRQ